MLSETLAKLKRAEREALLGASEKPAPPPPPPQRVKIMPGGVTDGFEVELVKGLRCCSCLLVLTFFSEEDMSMLSDAGLNKRRV